MIREFMLSDLDNVMTLWLEGNREAHGFIDQVYWDSQYAMVEKLIPQAEIFVLETKEKVVGFIGLIDGVIAGLFVSRDYRGQGVGKALVAFLKKNNSQLSLQVYKKNELAIRFYLKENFVIIGEQVDTNTNEPELVMQWKA